MKLKILCADNNMDDIKKSILDLNKSEMPILIKNGLRLMNESEWFSFLNNECSLKSDKRHYSVNSELIESKWWNIFYDKNNDHTFAHSKTAQPLHTDNAWFGDPAEMNFFIMKKQSVEGGSQTIYLLSHIIEDLKREDPKLLKDLSENDFKIKKGDSEYQYHGPIIDLRKNKPEIHWNFYRVLHEDNDQMNICQRFFDFLLNKEKTSRVFKIQSETGDCFAFNDIYLLHGREAFEATESKERVLLQSMWSFN